MQRANLSLRGLEVFLAVARSGSVRKVAAETGLSASTISHHLRGVEDSLGVKLLDHSRRPMVLTPSGSDCVPRVGLGAAAITWPCETRWSSMSVRTSSCICL